MRKYTRNWRISPNDEAALKATLLVARETSKNRTSIHRRMPPPQSVQVMLSEESTPFRI
jgi:transposase-like protein